MLVTAVIKSVKQAKELRNLVSTFIMPINDFSVNYESSFTLNEIKEVNEIKPVFVSLNKNIHNNELGKLKELLLEIEEMNISGIIFYDIALINLKKKLSLKTPLVWAQEHLTTNFGTIDYWYDKGAEYAYLSSELTKDEMDEIVKNTKAKLFVNVFGYLPMFTSRRHLVDNYLNSFNLESEKGIKRIYKEGKYYPIQDESYGTSVYSHYILNALDEDFSDYDYIVFNSSFISDEDFYDTLVKYNKKKEDYKFPYEHGFLYKETIYKVKKDA